MRRSVGTLLLMGSALAVACQRPEARPSRGEGPPVPRGPAAAPAASPSGAAPVAPAPPQPESLSAAPTGPGIAPAPPQPESLRAAPDPAPQASDDDAAAILERATRAYARVRSLQAEFVQHVRVPLLGQEKTSRGRLFVQRPDRLRMEFTDPAGDLLVADGQSLWLYTPSTDREQVIRQPLGAGGPTVDVSQALLDRPQERFVATLIGRETVAGRPAYVLSLVPKRPSSYRLLRVWIDAEDYLVRRFEAREENDTERRVELRALVVNPALPASLFRFVPPVGTRVVTP
jgi:outer membrane lipoprotein carrier protein